MLEIKNLHAEVDGTEILKGVDLKINPGEVHAIMGPNGSGKTTLLKLIAGITRPQSGEGNANGHSLFPSSLTCRRSLIYWGHAPLLYADLNAVENLNIALKIRSQNTNQSYIIETLTKCGLRESSNESVRTFSMGMLQRLNLARLVVSDWSIGLCDEPDNGLDSEGRSLLSSYIKQWQKSGCTLLFTSHNPQFIVEHASRVIYIQDGSINGDLQAPTIESINTLITGKNHA